MRDVTIGVAPFLSVRRGKEALAFYVRAFGATERFHHESADGAVVSKLAIEGAEFWVADESPEHGNYSPETLKGGTVRMVLTVPDPDERVARAVGAGARLVVPVENNYGWRLGRIEDPFGHHWEIGHPLDA